MNPNPLAMLKNFTVPVLMVFLQPGVAVPEIERTASNFRSEKTNKSAQNGHVGLAETNSTFAIWGREARCARRTVEAGDALDAHT
jgi:hypothetical protein